MESTPIKTLSVSDARTKLDAGDAVFLDIRDPDSYAQDHIPGAIHISDANVAEYVATTDKAKTHIVYCYHGITSQSGAGYFQAQGFADVYSMDGGFCAWER